MAKAFRKYFLYVVILLLTAWGIHRAHAEEKQVQENTSLYFTNICVGPNLECNDLIIGHGHSGKAFRDRVKYITEENFRAVFKSSVQKQAQAVTNYFTSATVSLSHYLLRLPVLTIADNLSVYIKSSLYLLLRVLRI